MREGKVTRLRQERLIRGWSLAKVANMIGVSPTALLQWEMERMTPSVKIAIRLSKLYRVDIDELFSA